MENFRKVLFFLLIITFSISCAVFAQDGEDVIYDSNDVDIKQDVEPAAGAKLAGDQTLSGVLNDEDGKYVLLSFDYGDIVLNVSEDKKEALKKLVSSEISVKGFVETKNNVLEMKVESFEAIKEVIDVEDAPKTPDEGTEEKLPDSGDQGGEDW